MKSQLIFLSISFLFFSCKETAAIPEGNTYYFSEPQPINDSELNSIPSKFIGFYSSGDSFFINISTKMITEERFNKFRIHNNYLDSINDELVKENGKYRFKNEDTFLEHKLIGDSIEFLQKDIDTFFIFSEKQKAKRINGKLVLNVKDSLYWQSKLVYLEKDELIIKYLFSEDDLTKMDSITKIKSQKMDSTTYLISPSRNEFKRFFEVKNFGYDAKYKKVSKYESSKNLK